MKMKSVLLCGIMGICLIVLGFGYHNQATQLNNQRNVVQATKKSNKRLKNELTKMQVDFNETREALAKKEAVQSNDPNNQVYQTYQGATEKVFDGLFTFTPSNYKERQKLIGAYLSDQLNDRYFGKKGYYGDGNQTTSKVLALHVYNRTVQNDSLDGFVVVTYQSKIQENEFKKATELFEVSFNVKSSKIQSIQSLGNPLKGDLIE